MTTIRTPKRAICRMNHVAVRGQEFGVEIGFGREVDLHQVLAPGVTLEQALGEHIARFELLDQDDDE